MLIELVNVLLGSAMIIKKVFWPTERWQEDKPTIDE